jgi:hypothetical protein
MAMPGMKFLRRMFGLDWRSLALMRIGLALVILCDLWVSAASLRAFYTDAGVLPRDMVFKYMPPDFSLHLLGGSAAFEAALFALEAVLAIMMLVGYRTRWATAGCWFLLMSRQARNPLVLFGPDMIERNAMFWAMFLPLDRSFSVDAARGRVPKPTEPSYLGIAGLGAIAQFLVIYMMSSVLKTGEAWQVEHSAVGYALSLDMYARPLGQWLNQYDSLTAMLTVYTLYVEFYAPLLLIFPVLTKWTRFIGVALLGTLQLGFGTTMQMGLFWVVMDVFLLMFLPAEFWTWVVYPAANIAKKLFNKKSLLAADEARPETPTRAISGWRRWVGRGWCVVRDGGLVVMMVCMILANIDAIPGRAPMAPAWWARVAGDLGLDGGYSMFTPNPQSDDGWFVLRGVMNNGQDVNVLTGASPASTAKPADVPATYIDQRWGSYFYDFMFPDYQVYLEGFALYEGGQWNATHTGGEQLASLQIIFYHQVNGPPHVKTDPIPALLWTENF